MAETFLHVSSQWIQNHGFAAATIFTPCIMDYVTGYITDKEPSLYVPEMRNQPLHWSPAEVLGVLKDTFNSNFMDLSPHI